MEHLDRCRAAADRDGAPKTAYARARQREEYVLVSSHICDVRPNQQNQHKPEKRFDVPLDVRACVAAVGRTTLLVKDSLDIM